jgi:hypothetical protein
MDDVSTLDSIFGGLSDGSSSSDGEGDEKPTRRIRDDSAMVDFSNLGDSSSSDDSELSNLL